ncbi:MAG: hypothetical protein NTW19_14110 [Planctomycetota bacterium]|nr:hypothetical protein [Planctomycetota bacterium]
MTGRLTILVSLLALLNAASPLRGQPTIAPSGASASAATQPRPAATAPATPGTSGADAASLRREGTARIEKAVKALIAEAASLDDLKQANAVIHFSRPHPALADIKGDLALQVLERMAQPITENAFRDTFIRWHLLHVVLQVDRANRRATGAPLLRLVRMMPGPLNLTAQRESYYEPEEIWQKWHALVGGGGPSPPQIVIGYPPFQRIIGAPESYKHLPADAASNYAKAVETWKVQHAKNLELAKQYEGKFKMVTVPGARTFNQRLSFVNYMVRQYRGELIYALIRSGDPEVAKLMMREIDRLARDKSGVAFDLLAYVYLAAFEGSLNLYDQGTLNEMSETLEGTARATDEYVSYGGATRNFAQYSFHLIYMLKDGGGFIEAEQKPKIDGNRFRPKGGFQ